MNFKFLLVTLFASVLSFGQSKGTIKGTVTDKDLANETLPFASVLIKGTTNGVNTDENGNYSLSVPEGSHTLIITFLGYETAEIPFTIAAGETKTIDRALGSSSVVLDDIVIERTVSREKESALLAEQKNAVEIKQSIGAQEMARKATSTVEQGLTKISGITNVAGRGLFVRGLDDRYNYLLVNGLPLASSDPEKKIIPLSYISTSVVESIDVFKTFSPTLYQDFAGATFNISTKNIPSNPTTVISIGAGLNTNTTFKDFYTDDSGSGLQNFLGYTGNSRAIPSVYDRDKLYAYNATPEESAGLFKTSWTPKKTTAPLDTKFGISHGQRLKEWDNGNFGMFFSMNYSNSYNTQQGAERRATSQGSAFIDFQSDRYEYATQKSGLLAFNYKVYDKLDLTFNTLYFQNSSNSVWESYGLNNSFTQLNDTPFYIRDIKYSENSVLAFQLLGDYQWDTKKNLIRFGASYSNGKNEMPDRRVLRTADRGENAEYITTNGINPFKFYQELDNNNINGFAEYVLGFDYDEESTKYISNFKVGYNVDYLDYDFFNRTVIVNFLGDESQTTINTNDPESFFQDGFANGYVRYSNTPDPTTTSAITQLINAPYVNFTKQWEKLLLEVGVRAEQVTREITYRTPREIVTSPFLEIKYDPLEVSPSLNIKYNLTNQSNLRLAASRTNTRPRLREILPLIYQKGDGNQTIGNPGLKNSTNYNFDLKYEVFPSNSEVLAIAAFGKYIQDPIERIFGFSAGPVEQFGNFDTAYLYGLELEGKINFGNTLNSEMLQDFTLGFNGIIMNSNSQTDSDSEFGQLTNKERKLQGASDWGTNIDLSYQFDNEDNITSTLTAVFNTYGKRIYAVGVDGQGDVYEKPVNQLDFIWNTEFSKKWGLRLTVQNILNQKTKFTQPATQAIQFPEQYTDNYETFNQGISFGLNLTYKL